MIAQYADNQRQALGIILIRPIDKLRKADDERALPRCPSARTPCGRREHAHSAAPSTPGAAASRKCCQQFEAILAMARIRRIGYWPSATSEIPVSPGNGCLSRSTIRRDRAFPCVRAACYRREGSWTVLQKDCLQAREPACHDLRQPVTRCIRSQCYRARAGVVSPVVAPGLVWLGGESVAGSPTAAASSA